MPGRKSRASDHGHPSRVSHHCPALRLECVSYHSTSVSCKMAKRDFARGAGGGGGGGGRQVESGGGHPALVSQHCDRPGCLIITECFT